MMKNYFLVAGLALAMGIGAHAQELPEEMYFVSNLNDWVTPDVATASQLTVLKPVAEGFYQCSFDYNMFWDMDQMGKIEFKLFSSKSNWDDPDSYWGTSNQEAVTYDNAPIFWDNMISGDAGSNFLVETYFQSKVYLSVDWNAKNVTLSDQPIDIGTVPPQNNPKELHLVGSFNDWDPTNYTYQLGLSVAEQEGTHYTGTFNLPAGEFKFVSGDNWDINFGTYDAYRLWSNEPTTLYMVANSPNNFNCVNWQEGGEITMDVDWDKKTVTFITPDQPEYTIPENLHLVGVFNDWDPVNHDYVLEKNSGVSDIQYSGIFEIPAAECEFKILSGDSWDDSFGTSYSNGFSLWVDEPVSFKMISGNCSNFNCTNWEGGCLKVVVNWTNYTVSFEGLDQPEYVKEDVIYLIGAPQGWDINSDAMKLKKVDTGEPKSALYSGSFEIKEGQAEFRFYQSLGNWDNGSSIGSQYEDASVDISLSSTSPYEGSAVWGKGNWCIPDWEGGTITMTVDLVSMMVKFSTETSGVQTVVSGDKGLRYFNGVITTSEASSIVVTDASGRVVMKVNSSSADLGNLPGGLYIVKAGKNAIKVMKGK